MNARVGAKKAKVIRPDELHLAVDRLYAAIITGEGGGEALDALARSMNAASCFFFPKEGAELLPRLPSPESIQPFLTEFVRDGWHLRDYRSQRGWPLAVSGRSVIIEHDLASDEERKRLPIYQELLRSYRVPWFAAIAFKASEQNWCMSILRLDEQGAFSREEAKILSVLAPRLAQLITLAEKFGEGRASGAMDALSRLGTPALLIDGFGRCLRANEHAESLFDEDFYLTQGRLRASDPKSNEKLQELIGSCGAERSGDRRTSRQEPVVIARRGRRPLMVDALPLERGFADAFSGAATLVTITDVASRPAPSEKLLTEIFALTPAEARLAVSLAGGATLESAADALSITRETARTRLKAVFAKTGTSRQAELAALLARLARP